MYVSYGVLDSCCGNTGAQLADALDAEYFDELRRQLVNIAVALDSCLGVDRVLHHEVYSVPARYLKRVLLHFFENLIENQ